MYSVRIVGITRLPRTFLPPTPSLSGC